MGFARLTAFVMLGTAAACSGPVLRPPSDPQSLHLPAQRPCYAVTLRSHASDGQLLAQREICALKDNTVRAETEYGDQYTIGVRLHLAESIAGCERLRFVGEIVSRDGETHAAEAQFECHRDCVPDGVGAQGGQCWHERHSAIDFMLSWPHRSPFVGGGSGLIPGRYRLAVTSEHGYLGKVEAFVEVPGPPPPPQVP